MRKKIAFVKIDGLLANGTEKWLQMMAVELKDKYDIDYYYSGTPDKNRLKYMQRAGINLIEFKLKSRNMKLPTFDWKDTNFWEVFDENKYDLVQTAKPGPPEYPFYFINKPVVEYITLAGSPDFTKSIVTSIHLSNWQRSEWFRKGGDLSKSKFIPIPAFEPTTNEDLRKELGIKPHDIVAGFHQGSRDTIFSDIPLNAFSMIAKPNYHFVIKGGGQSYRKQAKKLKLKNIHFVEHSSGEKDLSKFLNTLDIFAHGRYDGETFGTVFAEAMMHSKPCLTHWSPVANAQQTTIGPSGFFASNTKEYSELLKKLFEDSNLRNKLGKKGKMHAENNYTLKSCVERLDNIYREIFSKKNVDDQFVGYGLSPYGFLYAGDVTDPTEIAYHTTAGSKPEIFEISLVKQYLSKARTVLDIGANTGLYCFIAAKENPSCKIHVFEPQKNCCETLDKTANLNNWEHRISIHNIGLGDKKDKLKLYLSGTGSSFNNQIVKNKKHVTVNVKTLDEEVSKQHIKNIDFIKIDVEGFEYKTLIGATKTITQEKPIMFIELMEKIRNKDYSKTIDWIKDKGYNIYQCRGNTLKQIDSNAPAKKLTMYLCLHKNKHSSEISELDLTKHKAKNEAHNYYRQYFARKIKDILRRTIVKKIYQTSILISKTINNSKN